MKHFSTKAVRAMALAALLAGIGLMACEKRQSPVSTEAPSKQFVVANSDLAPHQQLARLVALALQDANVRNALDQAMEESPVYEGKLHLASYLRGSGGQLLAAMARSGGVTKQYVLNLLTKIDRQLEIYLPVPSHREQWEGGDNLIVATQIVESEVPFGVYLSGQPVSLTLAHPPSTPTLVIVPAESFERGTGDPLPRSLRASAKITPTGPTYDDSCEYMKNVSPSCTGGGGGGDGGGGDSTGPPCEADRSDEVQQRGVSVEEYICYMRTPNDHEPWTGGAPEFFILVAGVTEDGIEYDDNIIIPEEPWSGSDDDNNSHWRDFGGHELDIATWDTDLGTRVKVAAYEHDASPDETTVTLMVSTEFSGGTKVSAEVSFVIDGLDDAAGRDYIDIMNTNGEWYYIPDGAYDGDNAPYLNGTEHLEWYGTGVDRL